MRTAFIALMLQLVLSTGGLLHAEDTLFIDQTGNVGIGTEKPAAKLDVKGRITDESGFVMPKGGIIMWSGNINDIPRGWALCDGTNGTPDLRGRFITGAGADQTSPKANEKGEADIHNHVTAQQAVNCTTLGAGGHDHQTCTLYWYNNLTYGKGSGRSVVDAKGVDVHAERTSKIADHSHTVPVDLRGSKTGNSDGLNRPRWYALCFIMKL